MFYLTVLLEDESPHGNLRIIYLYYLTTTLTAVSPSTATATIPAGTAIVTLSDVRTVSATTLPKMLRDNYWIYLRHLG